MNQNFLRTSTKTCFRKSPTCLRSSRSLSSKATGWFQRFLSPAEEKKLYLGITSSFREKLVEQSNKSTQTYSRIIEHALFTQPSKTSKTGMLSVARLEQLKTELDEAGKQKDVNALQQLQLEMDNADLTAIAIYNRLIRAYLWCDELTLAQDVLSKFEERGLVPTVRTFTYLIQAHLKKDQLEEAKRLVEEMHRLSLSRLRNNFDCSIMLKFYQACGDSHAIEYLWRDMMAHADAVKPGFGLFTQYVEYLISKKDLRLIAKTSQEFLAHHHQPSEQQLLPHQYMTWVKSINLLVNNKANTQTADQLLFFLIKKAPPKMPWDKVKDAIECIVKSYLNEEQELKALAFYYKLRKQKVPDQAFEQETLKSIEIVLQHVEKKSDQKQVMAELEGLVLFKA
ncbi:uncharacterized protein B0P05DRAFT_511408 [Gilbertella persicaria]|uniref:uncharacterized protein n=1 Tax=Gilbertella persicaria TaxID=101096 RepID=UPI00221EFC07|nr:uncharacterized protein B0P05DRAFT_511408 [Gilbertella persicaria]KAI8077381.1 hypothetical protein B0P05DRAFT_511408 [Gilbertella persicaria]